MAELVITEGGPKSLRIIARELGTDRHTVNTPTITASPDWQGRLILFSVACVVTIPADLPSTFSCGWSQESAGAITFQAGAGETLQSFGNLLTSAGIYAIGGIAGFGTSKHRLYGQLA